MSFYPYYRPPLTTAADIILSSPTGYSPLADALSYPFYQGLYNGYPYYGGYGYGGYGYGRYGHGGYGHGGYGYGRYRGRR